MDWVANILLAEDEETDAFFLKLAFRKAGLPHRILHVTDGQAALDYLNGAGIYADRETYPRPHLFLLDLKMPRLTGFDVLSRLQTKPELKSFPVIVLTSSNYPADREKAARLGAAGYQVKPSDPQDMVRMALELAAQWLQPKNAPPAPQPPE